jgi:hypothetical protein
MSDGNCGDLVEEWQVYADNEPIRLLMEAGAE